MERSYVANIPWILPYCKVETAAILGDTIFKIMKHPLHQKEISSYY